MSDARSAPYPASTRAKGWRFELDYEKIEQSSTWDLAAEVPMAQHALLMMWLVAWRQEPCGALPNDEDLIRAKCRIPRDQWDALRPILMRGWWEADDGLLYHDTIVLRVLEMQEFRRKEAARRAGNRSKTPDDPESPADVPRDTTGVPRDDTVSPGTGTGTVPSEPTVPRKARKRADTPPPCPDDVDGQVWADWLRLRATKRAEVTATVIGAARQEAATAGMTFEAFLRVWCLRGTQGLLAEWLKPHERAGPAAPANRQEAIERRNRAVGDEWLAEQEAMHAGR